MAPLLSMMVPDTADVLARGVGVGDPCLGYPQVPGSVSPHRPCTDEGMTDLVGQNGSPPIESIVQPPPACRLKMPILPPS